MKKIEIRCVLCQYLNQCAYATIGNGHVGCSFKYYCEGQRPKRKNNAEKHCKE